MGEALLDADGLPYAIIGAFALLEYGYRRVTVDVDLVMREDDLQEFKRRHLGRGYVERAPNTGKLLDTEFGVNVDVRSSGRFPGDDKPQPIAFPDPTKTAVRGARFSLLPMPLFIELKLASGMVAPHRGKDLVDVQKLIRSAHLSRQVSLALDPWVRDKFPELWELAQWPTRSDRRGPHWSTYATARTSRACARTLSHSVSFIELGARDLPGPRARAVSPAISCVCSYASIDASSLTLVATKLERSWRRLATRLSK
jgi:hypothetical protein